MYVNLCVCTYKACLSHNSHVLIFFNSVLYATLNKAHLILVHWAHGGSKFTSWIFGVSLLCTRLLSWPHYRLDGEIISVITHKASLSCFNSLRADSFFKETWIGVYIYISFPPNWYTVCAFLPLSPPGWRGIVVTVRAGGRAGGCQTCGTHISVTAGLTDFLHSKFCGIV